MENYEDELLKWQKAAGQVLSQICNVSGVGRSKFCDIILQFLGNIDVQTVQGYFRKVPYKRIGPEDGYASFRLSIVDSIDEICTDNPWGERGRKVAEQNWAQYGEALLARMDEIHERVFALAFQKEQEKIDKFLA